VSRFDRGGTLPEVPPNVELIAGKEAGRVVIECYTRTTRTHALP